MKSFFIFCFFLFPVFCFANIDSDTLTGLQPRSNQITTHTSLPSKELFNLKPNMNFAEVKKQGIVLKPYIKYITPTEYGVHAFYGMESYEAENLPKILPDLGLIILTFSQHQQLKLIQVESTVFRDQANLKLINQRVKKIADQFSKVFGHYELAHQHNNYHAKQLPIYKMKTDDVWVSITPLIKEKTQQGFDVVYVIKYFVQDTTG